MLEIESIAKKCFYFDGFESFCYQNCIANIWSIQGIKNSPLYIDCSLDLSYKIENDGYIELFMDPRNRGPLEPYVNCVERQYEDDDKWYVFNKNIEYVNETNNPLIVGVDTYYLHYATNYAKNHAVHTLLLIGYDEHSKEVKVVDWYKPWLFAGGVNVNEFLEARSSRNEFDGTIFSGFEIRNNWALVRPIENEKTVSELIKLQIGLSLERYYGAEGITGSQSGFEALRLISGFLKKNEDDCFNLVSSLSSQFYLWEKRINLFVLSLSMASKSINSTFLNEIIVDYQRVLEEWRKINYLCIKLRYRKEQKILDSILNCLNIIIEYDYKLKEKLNNLNRSL